MSWYSPYLETYERPLSEVRPEIIQDIRARIQALQSPTPLVTVSIIAYNEEKHLVSCLWSLSQQQTHFPMEIIGVNNNSLDRTEELLNNLGVITYNETKKGPGHARQCGLSHARGKYHICIDADTMYPPLYVETMVKALQKEGTSAVYGLWSFIPDVKHSALSLYIYESLRDLYLTLQNINRPELNVRGMVFAFPTQLGKKYGFRTDIIRGEDGSLALELKNEGRLTLLHSRKVRAITGYGTMNQSGGMASIFWKRIKKACSSISGMFTTKSHYQDEDSNLIKP